MDTEKTVKLNKANLRLGGGTLLQVANRSHIQMMSYVITTPENELVIIDGGNDNEEDGAHLYDIITEHGGRVSAWFITHAHNDHYGALSWMMANKPDFDTAVTVDALYFDFPPAEWFKDIQGGTSYAPLVTFLNRIKEHGIKVLPLKKDDVISVGGMSFEVLNDCENYKAFYSVNDTSCAIRAHYPKRDVLFLADFEVPGGEYLLKVCGVERLRCDIVQLSHHGQGGISEDIYKLIKPKHCLYTAPDWLWNNDNGNGENTGPYKTFETRGWMEKLNVEASYVHADGDWLFY